MKIKNRQEFLVVLTIAAFALLVGVNFILEPLGGWWSARQAQIKELRAEVTAGQQLIRREAGIRSRWADMTANALPGISGVRHEQSRGKAPMQFVFGFTFNNGGGSEN